MFKTSEEIIVIQAEATTAIPTGVVFWSHDKGTAKMLFQLQKDYVNQTLSEGTIVPICLDFVGGRHIYHAIIEDAINGIVSIVLEDNILGYVGRVTGSIYIELPDSRSLDTAGRFTFDIKRSPIDLNTPELEDYYWQGFNEIIDEYHQTINTIKSEAKALIDSITADVTTAQSKITQLEQSITTANTNLNARIDEINKKIDDNDVFTKAESSANVIDQIIGKEKGQISIITDFKNKVTNSNVENPHWAGAAFVGDKLEKPSYFVTEVAQTRYNSLSEKDGNTAFVTATGADLRPSLCLKYDLLEIVKRRLGEDFFIDREATTTEQQLSLLDAIVTNFEVGTYAKGTGVEAGKATNWCASKLWFDNSRWTTGTPQNTTGEIKRLAFALDPVNKLSRYLDEKGILQVIVYGGLSDGVTNTNVYVDYSDLLIDIEVSSNKHIKSIVAANHIENIATEEEAEAGENNEKTMTPLRVFQAIAKWTKDKFVSRTENETVLGVKNFANGLQVGGNNVLTQNGEIRFVTNSTNNSSLESGSIVFKRYGDDVDIYANFQVRASGDLTRDMNIVAESIVDDIFEPGENFSFFVGNETAQAVVKFVGKGIKAHSTLTKGIWYVGTASYKAKNKL
ncbi:phage baseplate upper protein [Enterococcus raffinosus]|uniref:phage baseplate upper protein n=2 Tax=Enterococcus raffinosus TaxID=71452 RepID=UPI0021AB323F|nr:phage baseplate upper protein [Enterococcus raffinosus]